MKATNGKVLTKIVSFVLSVLLLFYAIPGVVYSETIDALSEINTEINKAGNAEQKNQIVKIADESRNLTDIGNTTSVSAGDNELAEYTYGERNGKLQKITYGNGYTVEYVYNDIELLTEVWYTKGTEEKTLAYEYEYTSDGQVHEFIDHGNEKSTVYKYDTDNRLIGFIEYANGDLYHDYSSNLSYNDKGELGSVYYYLNYANGTTANDFYNWRYLYSYENDGKISNVQLITENTNGREYFYYDEYDRVSGKRNNFISSNSTSNKFDNQISYTYKTYSDRTSSWVESYTSTVNSGTALTYTYTYDQNGNITKVVYSTGQEIRYVYDDLGQLLREDNGLRNATYVYTYDNAGNITSKKTYALTAEGTTPSSPTSTYNYGYSSGTWGDMLTSYRGGSITYDAIGNPLTYYNGSSYTFTWTGRQLTGAVKGSNSYTFVYNDEGIRTSKTKNGVTTTYYLNGSQIVGEETNGNITVYLYDSQGMPIGMQYHGADYAADVWNTYWYEKNLQGDVVAVYTHAGTKLVSYKYDAWGNTSTTYHNGGSITSVANNPFKYRGYYYDADLSLYYLNTRYYDAKTGRFISPDDVGYLGANGDLNGYNLYAYCSNNPITYTDPSGNSIIATLLIGAGIGLFSQLASDLVTSAIDGELSFSHWTSYVGAAAGGAVGNIMPGSKVLGDVIGSTVSTIVGMGGHNIVNRIQGKQSEYSDEEIMYTAMNNAMLTGLTSTVVRNCKYAADLESFKLPIPKIEITGMDLAVGAFPAYVDGIRNSKPFSTLSKWAHGW